MDTQVGAIVRRPIVFVVVGLICLVAALAVNTGASAAPLVPGNNGTLKIHEQGTPSGTENNDPKVCVFNVEAFNLDAGQEGNLMFSVQGGDGPAGSPAGPYAFGPADANGFYATQYFNLDPGHYKATLFGKQLPNGPAPDEKAKSKVFKVICDEASPSPSVVPSESVSPSPSVVPSESASPSPSVLPSESVEPSPSVLPSESTDPSPSVAPSESTDPSPSVLPTEASTAPSPGPGVLPAEGAQVPRVPVGGVSAGGGSTSGGLHRALQTLGGSLLAGAALLSMLRRRAKLRV